MIISKEKISILNAETTSSKKSAEEQDNPFTKPAKEQYFLKDKLDGEQNEIDNREPINHTLVEKVLLKKYLDDKLSGKDANLAGVRYVKDQLGYGSFNTIQKYRDKILDEHKLYLEAFSSLSLNESDVYKEFYCVIRPFVSDVVSKSKVLLDTQKNYYETLVKELKEQLTEETNKNNEINGKYEALCKLYDDLQNQHSALQQNYENTTTTLESLKTMLKSQELILNQLLEEKQKKDEKVASNEANEDESKDKVEKKIADTIKNSKK